MCEIKIKDLLPLGFVFIDEPEDTVCYPLSDNKRIYYNYIRKFSLVLNGCCMTCLNIENINDLILAIDLLKNN